MKLYHRTEPHLADRIMDWGFMDGVPRLRGEWPGVWTTRDRPLDGAWAWGWPAVIVVEIPKEVAAPYEWVLRAEGGTTGHAGYQELTGWRPYLVPARVLNAYPTLRVR